MKRGKIIFQYNAPVTLTFSLLALGALILSQVFGSGVTLRYFSVYRASLTDPLTYLRFFTHVLGHSGVSHYINNIMLMLVIGPTLEERYGCRHILLSIVLTALICGLIQFIFFPDTVLCGASGIVFMMILMASLGGMRGGGIPLTLIFVLILYIGGEIYNGLFQSDNISQLTHIIGGLCGATFGIVLRRS